MIKLLIITLSACVCQLDYLGVYHCSGASNLELCAKCGREKEAGIV